MEPYYYHIMDKASQTVYYAMKAGLTALAPSFSVPRLEGKELSRIFFLLRLDCPEIFCVSGFQYRFYPGSPNVEIIPEYLFDKDKIKDHQKAMKARILKLARPAEGMGEWEKEKYIHDFICTSVRYDKLKKPYSHEIIGPLGQGVGVCEGIAKAVKALCDKLGLWCIIAVSEADPEKNIKYRHAWNIIKIGSEYYHLDATFDNSLGRDHRVRYDYFNLDDKRIFLDHQPVIEKTPECSCREHFYYKEVKMSFTKIEDVEKRAAQAVRKGKPLIFHWRGGYLTREVIKQLAEILQQTARKKEKYAKISLNWPQGVMQADFYNNVCEEEVILEDANEGENIK